MDLRTKLSHFWINGKGIEIGAARSPLSVKHDVTVTYVDRAPPDEISEIHSNASVMHNAIVIDNAETLAGFKNESQDFVIANHVFEYTENPIGTLESWLRVLKPGGVIYAAITDKRFTPDHKRAVTPFVHLIIDYTQGPEASRQEHYDDWNTHVDILDPNIRFHVWDYAAIIDMFKEFEIRFGIRDLQFYQNGYEIICVCRKGS